MLNTNEFEWPQACCVYPCIQLHYSPHSPGAHGSDIQNCQRYVMEIMEDKLVEAMWWCRDISIKAQWNDLHAVNCQSTAQGCDRATSFHTQITLIEVDQKLRGHQASGCKWQDLETQLWMSIMNMQCFAYNDGVSQGCFDVFNVDVNRVSMIFSLTHWTIRGLYCLILQK